MSGRRTSALLAVVAVTAASLGPFLPSSPTLATASGFEPLPGPRRLLDTRPGGSTFDGRQQGTGAIAAGTAYRLPVTGRAGLRSGADAVAVNIAAIEPAEDGYVTAYSCDSERPGTSSLNYRRGEVVSGMTIAPLAADGSVCLFVRSAVDLAVDAIGTFDDSAFAPLSPAERLLDTRPGETTVDGDYAGGGPVGDGETLVLDLAGRGTVPSDPGPLAVTIAAVGRTRGHVTAWNCDGDRPLTSNLNFVADRTAANAAVIQVDEVGRTCLFVRGHADLVLDVVGEFTGSAVQVLHRSARLLDTRPELPSIDGLVDDTGLRRGSSTLRVQTAARGGVPASASAAIVNVFAVEPSGRGYVTAHPPAAKTPVAANLNHPAGRTVGNLAIVPLDEQGEICVFNRTTTHLVVDVVAYVSGGPTSPAAPECPGQDLFPHWRMLALYGTNRASVLGVLGEQPPDAAARRLESIAAPWRAASDRPILPTFELIATIALATPGPSGLYRSRSSPERVQAYLDAARRNGMYLLLDLQPGQSDFLTEAKAYERFLREPDVGLALDPEWRTAPPATPGGGYIGQVDASEVNAVAEWLATLVAEEDLPEKLLVVHQFQIRMITNKDDLREPDGIALTIHMDGFGTRSQKLTTYSYVHVDPPLNNGFKLFFDEDVNRFGPTDLLGGAVQPVPDVITYQ